MIRILLALALAGGLCAAPAAAFDTAGMDAKVRPGDDFFRFANGSWLASTEIPADRAGWGVFGQLAEKTAGELRGLLEGAQAAPAGSPVRKAGDYYAAYMDEARIEAQGLKPLQPTLDRIAAVRDKQGLAREFGLELRADVDALNSTDFYTGRLFGLWVEQDLNNPNRYAAYLLQGGLGMPDRDFYVSEEPRMATIRAAYRTHLAKVLKLTGLPDGEAGARADRIFALETKIARVHAARADSEDVRKADNPWARPEFASRAPGLDWRAFFTAAGLENRPRFIIWHPKAVAGEAALVASEPLSVWKEYLALRQVEQYAAVLPKAFADERFAFYGKVLSGTPEQAARWKRAADSASANLGEAVGQAYVARYFPPESKAAVRAMVDSLIKAFDKRIGGLDWMAPATKAEARRKLKTLKVGVGYPDRWIDYSSLAVSPTDALGNLMRAELFEYRRNLAKLGHTVDRGEWAMTPQTVNAVNLPVRNAINFPAAILQPPVFDPKAPAAVNFGSVGATIGHEISHSFDDQGAQFDAMGKLRNWWKPDDLAHFHASGRALAAQFSAYRPFPDLALKGEQVLSENIADIAGLAAAYDAYREAAGRSPPLLDGFSGDQQFFLAFAQSWRTKRREAALRQQVVTDGHAPDEFRADTVRNMDAWYDAFAVKPGETLYLAPAQRVKVW